MTKDSYSYNYREIQGEALITYREDFLETFSTFIVTFYIFLKPSKTTKNTQKVVDVTAYRKKQLIFVLSKNLCCYFRT